MPKKSNYTLVIYFIKGRSDGKPGPGRFSSNDRKKNKNAGLNSLRKLIEKYKNEYSTAMIFDANNSLIEKYVYNEKVDIAAS